MELRAYFFGNMYLSSIQQGIQAAHVVADMFVKYNDPEQPGYHPLHEWASDHKTMILLNAGYSEQIRYLIEQFDTPDNPYPWAAFHEGADALDGALTSVGIILPEYIWIGAKQIKESWVDMGDIMSSGQVTYSDWNNNMKTVTYDITKWEFDALICQLNNYGLAR